MNATPLVLQPSAANQVARSSQTTTADDGATSAAADTSFAGALHNAAPKPTPAPEGKTGVSSAGKPSADSKSTRKPAPAKAAKAPVHGDTLPATGNPPPVSAPPAAMLSLMAAAPVTVSAATPAASEPLESAAAKAVTMPAAAPTSPATSGILSAPAVAVATTSAVATAPAVPTAPAVATAPAVTKTPVAAAKPPAAADLQPSGKASASDRVSTPGSAPANSDPPTNLVAQGPALATGAASSADAAVSAAALAVGTPSNGAAKPAFVGAPDADSDGAPGVSGVAAGTTDVGAADAAAASGSAATPASLQAAAIARSITALADPAGADKHSHDDPQDPAAGSIGDGAAALSQLSATQTSAASDAAPTPTLRVHANVDSAEFAQSLSDRVSYMVGNGLNGAKLQVNPPQLGPIEVRIAIQGDHAQVWMTAHSMVTRDALEASAPKLHEMLGSQGFGQVSVDISQRSFQERSAFSQPYERAAPTDRAPSAPTTISAASAARVSASGLDAYA